jgi:PTH1 family peptidyl-tRNA hydrolase
LGAVFIVYLFVGLGNCGKDFENTRHNFGFLCVDSLRERYGLDSGRTKFDAEIFRGTIENRDVIIARPTTFMNNSGTAVLQIKSFYKIQNEKIFVFHDDLDLELCRIKIKTGGHDGGHRGLKSIDTMIGKAYHRIRLGIGRPAGEMDVSSFVLSRFSSEEMERVRRLNLAIADALADIFDRRENFLNRVASALDGPHRPGPDLPGMVKSGD